LTRPDAPYAVRQATPDEGVDLIGEWRIADTEWRALFANGTVRSRR
jgi:hypothetical protein